MTTQPKTSKRKRLGLQLDTPLLAIIAVVSFLIYVHFQISTEITTKEQVKRCHTYSLVASETLDDTIDDVEYYEFLYKTCMREVGNAI